MADKEKKENHPEKINSRTMFLAAFLAVVAFFLVYVLFNLQIIDENNYKDVALRQQTNIENIPAMRGTIYDRNKKVLAQSASTWMITASPKILSQNSAKVNLISQELAMKFGLDALELVKKFSDEKNEYYLIVRKVEEPVVDEIIAFAKEHDINGLYYYEDYKRYYPYDDLAASVLGFVNDENIGGEGLEYYYNENLSGISGRSIRVESNSGIKIPLSSEQLFDPENGHSLVLTIDETVQRKIEDILKKAVAENKVKNRGVAIVMNVNTGEIHAMAVVPSYDPNKYKEIFDPSIKELIKTLPKEDQSARENFERQRQYINKAVTEAYEPGSVFKIITAAAGLDSGTSVLTTEFGCNGSFQIQGEEEARGCHLKTGHGTQNFVEVIMHSCNPGTIVIGQRMGIDIFYKYRQSFGFGEKTGIDLPGETKGIIYPKSAMAFSQLASASFGQSETVTPIQMITGVAAAVNGGYLVTPRIVNRIEDANGNVVESFSREVKRQAISEEVSAQMSEILEKAVSEPSGSGRNAYVRGYRIGGKTGTSQKLDTDKNEITGGYETISSFVGIAPSDNPEYAILVLLDEPYDPNSYASTLAAPIVGQMFEAILPDLGVKPKYTDAELAEVSEMGTVPNVTGYNSIEAEGIVRNAGFEVKLIGESGKIVSQVPPVGTPIQKGSLITLKTENAKEDEMALVPNVINMKVAQAKNAMENVGININVKGDSSSESRAKAHSQSVPDGLMVPVGSIIDVEFLVYDQVA